MRLQLVIALLVGVHVSLASAQPEFFGLGDLPGGDFYSGAYGVSTDGRFVVGGGVDAQGYRAFIWSSATGINPLPDGPGGFVPTLAGVVAPDGLTVAGGGSPYNNEAFRWTAANGTEPIGDLAGLGASVYDMSADGSVLVGSSKVVVQGGPPASRRAFRWTEADGMIDLGTAYSPDSWSVDAYAVTGSGANIYGRESGRQAGGSVQWTEQTGMQPFLPLPLGVYDTSSDGTLVLGGRQTTGRLSLWSEAAGYTDIPLSIVTNLVTAKASDAGDVVILSYHFNQDPPEYDSLYLWQPGDPYIQQLNAQFLADRFGLDTEGWFLTRVDGLSADGLTIVGQGYNPSGSLEAWVAVIPEPGTLTLLAFGALVGYNRRRR